MGGGGGAREELGFDNIQTGFSGKAQRRVAFFFFFLFFFFNFASNDRHMDKNMISDLLSNRIPATFRTLQEYLVMLLRTTGDATTR